MIDTHYYPKEFYQLMPLPKHAWEWPVGACFCWGVRICIWFGSVFSLQRSVHCLVSASPSLGGSPSPLSSPHHAEVGDLRCELLHTAQSLASAQAARLSAWPGWNVHDPPAPPWCDASYWLTTEATCQAHWSRRSPDGGTLRFAEAFF